MSPVFVFQISNEQSENRKEKKQEDIIGGKTEGKRTRCREEHRSE